MKIKIALTCVTLVVPSVFFYQQEKKIYNLDNLLLENVDALANNEETIHTYSCYGKGSVDCPNNNQKAEIVFKPFSL